MQSIYFWICLGAVFLGAQAQNDTPSEGTTGVESNGAALSANTVGTTAETVNNEGTSNNGGERTSAPADQFLMTKPDGAGIQAGFQAAGPNFATSVSGGLKSTDGTTLESGLNFAGRLGNSGQSSGVAPTLTSTSTLGVGADQQQPVGNTQQPNERSTQQTSSGQEPVKSSTTAQDLQNRREQDEGATFVVSYKPGLLSAIGNMLNPFRIAQQLGGALGGFMGLNQGQGQGQSNAMVQAQSQYSPPQASRSNNNNNGVGITWKPLYRAFW